jgi:MATE family multidrug resistance protein
MEGKQSIIKTQQESRKTPSIDESLLVSNNSSKHDNADEVNFKFVLMNLTPNLLNSILYFFIGIIETHFIGTTKNTHLLDGVALGLLYNNIVIYYLGIGITESLAIIASRSFGSLHFKLISDQTNQVRILIAILFAIYCILSYFLGIWILELIAGQDKDYTDIAHRYILYTMPSVFLDLNFEIYAKYAEAQQVYKPIMISFVFACICHPLSCWMLISKFEMEELGAALASNITQFLKIGSIFIYFIFFNPYPDSHKCFNTEMFKKSHIWPTLKVSLLSMITFYAENLGVCISNLISNSLNEISYAKVVVLLNINLINYSISYAFLNTISNLVGNFIGENSPKKIKKLLKMLAYFGLAIEIPLLLSFLIFKSAFFKFFSEDPEVYLASDLNNMIYLVIYYGAIDFVQAFLLGFLRGLEILKLTTSFSMIVFLGILPIQSSLYTFVFKLDIFGIILAECVSYTVATLIWAIYTWRFVNIEKVCEDYKIEEPSLIE